MQEPINLTPTPYAVAVDADDYVIRVRRDLIERDDLARLVDALLFSSIRRRSLATDEDIAALVADVKRAAWQQVAPLLPDTPVN